MDSIYQKTADRLYPDSLETSLLKKKFFNLLAYIQENDWAGACHATTSIWIEVNSKICDAAVTNTLIDGVNFPPVFMSTDLDTEKITKLQYGSKRGNGLDFETTAIAQMSIGKYMQNFPKSADGLWDIAKQLAKQQSLEFSVPSAKRKWGEASWNVTS